MTMELRKDEYWEESQRVSGWRISNTGKVYSDKSGKLLKQQLTGPNRKKYFSVSIRESGKVKHLKVHRLVAEEFIPNPDNKPCVNHKDGNKLNNHVDNLEWATASENSFHAVDTGLNPKRGKDNPNVKLSQEQVNEIRTVYFHSKISQSALARKYNVHQTTIHSLLKYETWN